MTPCDRCNGVGIKATRRDKHHPCRTCNGSGWLGIDSSVPTQHRPGSPEKVAVLEQRYADGQPLFQDGDSIAVMPRRRFGTGIQMCSTQRLPARLKRMCERRSR